MQQEQRLTLRLRSYWEMIRKGQPLPNVEHFNSTAVEDLWPYCFRISISTDAEAVFKYDYMGAELSKLYGTDLTGQTARERAPQFPGMIIYQKLQEIARKATPLTDEGHFVTQKGQMIKYRACLLPFGGKGRVSHIIVGLTYRSF